MKSISDFLKRLRGGYEPIEMGSASESRIDLPKTPPPTEATGPGVDFQLRLPTGTKNVKFDEANPDGNCLIESFLHGLPEDKINQLVTTLSNQDILADIYDRQPALRGYNFDNLDADFKELLIIFSQLANPLSRREYPSELRNYSRVAARTIIGFFVARILASQPQFHELLLSEVYEFLSDARSDEALAFKRDIITKIQGILGLDTLLNLPPQIIANLSSSARASLPAELRVRDLPRFSGEDLQIILSGLTLNSAQKTEIIKAYFENQAEASNKFYFSLSTIKALAQYLNVNMVVFTQINNTNEGRVSGNVSYVAHSPLSEANPAIGIWYRKYAKRGEIGTGLPNHGDPVISKFTDAEWQGIQTAIPAANIRAGAGAGVAEPVPAIVPVARRTPHVAALGLPFAHTPATVPAPDRVPTPTRADADAADAHVNRIIDIDNGDDDTVSNADTDELSVTERDDDVSEPDSDDDVPPDVEIKARVSDLVPVTDTADEPSNKTVLIDKIIEVWRDQPAELMLARHWAEYGLHGSFSHLADATDMVDVTGLNLQRRLRDRTSGKYQTTLSDVPNRITKAHAYAQIVDRIEDFHNIWKQWIADGDDPFVKIHTQLADPASEVSVTYNKIKGLLEKINPNARIVQLFQKNPADRFKQAYELGPNNVNVFLGPPESVLVAWAFGAKHSLLSMKSASLSTISSTLRRQGINVDIPSSNDTVYKVLYFLLNDANNIKLTEQQQMKVINQMMSSILEDLQAKLNTAERSSSPAVQALAGQIKRDIVLVASQWAGLYNMNEVLSVGTDPEQHPVDKNQFASLKGLFKSDIPKSFDPTTFVNALNDNLSGSLTAREHDELLGMSGKLAGSMTEAAVGTTPTTTPAAGATPARPVVDLANDPKTKYQSSNTHRPFRGP